MESFAIDVECLNIGPVPVVWHNIKSSSLLPLHSKANLRPARGNLCTPPLPFGRPTPHRNCLPETVPWPVGPDTRQCPYRYAFCVGRNLPDKEFCYLSTAIVTTTVHRASVAGSPVIRSPTSLAFWH
ncbi:UNVERIFIED_CONTAM: putative protein ORF91 [Sesamum indicum]